MLTPLKNLLKPLYRSAIEIFWSWLYIEKLLGSTITSIKRQYWYRYWSLRLNKLGSSSKIYGPITILNPQKVSIGNEVTLNHGVMIVAKTETVTIGDRVRISAGTKILATGLNTELVDGQLRQHESLPVNIGDDCWIGANAVITAGVTIGSRSVVAAGAVVNADVAVDSIVGGVPAKVIKSIKT